jgi:hypothetical protein
MKKEFYLKHIADLSTQEIVNGIRLGIVTFRELANTGEFLVQKQKHVKSLLEKYSEEDDAYKAAQTKKELQHFLSCFPKSGYFENVTIRIEEIENEEIEAQKKLFLEIRANINDFTPDELKTKLNDNQLRNICEELDIDYSVFNNWDEPELNFNNIPQSSADVPEGYTDVFFWGIPSSGKTCALSAILRTIKDKYVIASPNTSIKFGATYRDSLVNIFRNGTGYLPAATQKDRTQYMPFLLKRRNEKRYRQLSFFELSGEVFKYFYEIINSKEILDDTERNHVVNAFNTLSLLLSSENQKIHFFFIDYNEEKKGGVDKHGLTQENYLDAAATYFRDRNNIFKKKTDAVYVVVTKSDIIDGDDKPKIAEQFLFDKFGSFMDIVKQQCKEDSVAFGVKLFSIGDVFFKRICRLNTAYAEDIIDDLFSKTKPINRNRIIKFLNQ